MLIIHVFMSLAFDHLPSLSPCGSRRRLRLWRPQDGRGEGEFYRSAASLTAHRMAWIRLFGEALPFQAISKAVP